jgi:hypothetical protein
MPIQSTRILLSVLWLACAAAGIARLWKYASTPGAVSQPAERLVSASSSRRAGLPTLVMLVHPRCPCSRASLEELGWLMARYAERVNATVLFFTPAGADERWAHTDLWRSAREISELAVEVDCGGAAARRLGAVTSGHTLVYDRDGSLLFSGGITAGRGHQGDSMGRSTVEALLLGQAPETRGTPVFGCKLLQPERES